MTRDYHRRRRARTEGLADPVQVALGRGTRRPTADDWCPSYAPDGFGTHPRDAATDGAVRVFLLGPVVVSSGARLWSVVVWGADDLAMERQLLDEDAARREVCTLPPVITKAGLELRGFTYW